MAITSQATWTAVTAEIQFLGESVGELQDFTIDENFNVQRITAIGSPVDIRHVPGVYQATVTSRRAFIDMNVLFSAMTTLDAFQVPGTVVGPSGSNEVVLTDVAALKQAIAGTTLTRNTIMAAVDFDIIIKQKRLVAGATKADSVTLYTLNSCTMNTRNSTLSAGNVIIMENVNITARSRTMGDAVDNWKTGG